MLVLTVVEDQIIKIGDALLQVKAEGNKVRVFFDAPPEVRISRIVANTIIEAKWRLAKEGEGCVQGFSKLQKRVGGGSCG